MSTPHPPPTSPRRSARAPLHRARLLLAAAAMVTGGCATMVNGRYQQIPVASTPAGAVVFVDGAEQGRTPCVVRVTRHDNHTIRLASEGHDAGGVTLRRELTPWTWLNVLNGGLPGIAADATTGGLYDLSPRAVDVALQPSRADSAAVAPGTPP